MPCRRCGADVAPGLLLCGACSVLAAPVCGACGIASLPGARYCDQCGAKLSSPRPSRNVPAHAAPGVASQTTRTEVSTPGRRQLTVLFSDLVNSTLLSRELDPEDLRDVISDYQIICTRSIERHGGFVAQYLGDGILAYFGQPVAHEDDAERAIRAALMIVRHIDELGHRLGREKNVRVNVRIGLATGLVFVGTVPGFSIAMDNNAVGEAPNLAAKLQALAEPNTIVVCQQTKQLAAAHFEYRDLGLQAIKGLGDAIPVWQVTEEQVSSRFDARRGTALPLIGREEEIATLLKRWERAQHSEGQLALVQGKAGIGKSRLIAEIRDRLLQGPGESPHVIAFQCSQLHSNTPLYAVIRQFEYLANVHASDTNVIRQGKLAHLIDTVERPHEERARILAFLSAGTYEGPELAQEARRLTLDALNNWFAALAAHRPLLLIFEDVQWLDPTSRVLLESVAGWMHDARILLVASLRSDAFDVEGARNSHDIRTAEWLKFPHAVTLSLEELSNRQSREIVASLAPGALLSPGVIDAVLEKAEGIPLFVEELTKGAIAALTIRLPAPVPYPTTLPSTITGSLAARLDAVGSAKEVAQHAAVIGREFSFDMLQRIANVPAETLHAAVDALAHAELINKIDQRSPASTYAFKHGLIRDAAYQSMPRRRRTQIHLDLATAFQETGQQTDLAGHAVVAQHYSLGGAHREAVDNWRRAAELAFARSAQSEAANLLQRALSDVRELPDEERLGQEFNLTMKLAAALRSVHGYGAPEVEERYLQALRLCDACGAAEERQYVEWGLMQCNLVRGNLGGAKRFATIMMRNAAQSTIRSPADAYLADGMVRLNLGDFTGSKVSLDRAVELAGLEADEPHLLTHGQHPRIFAVSYLAQALWLLGFPEQARLHIEENLNLARAKAQQDASQTHSYVNALAFALRIYQCRREPQHVLAYAEELIEVSRKKHYAYYEALATIFQGWAKATMHNGAAGLSQICDALVNLERTGAVLALRGCRLYLAELYHKIDMNDEAAKILDAAAGRAAWGTRVWDAEIHRLRGLILASGPEPDLRSAEVELRKSIESANRQNARSLRLRATVSLARFLMRFSRQGEIELALGQAMDELSEGRDSVDFIEAQDMLYSTLHSQQPSKQDALQT